MWKSNLVILSFLFIFLSAAMAQDAGDKTGTQTKSEAATAFQNACEQDLVQARQAFEALKAISGPKTIATVLVPMNDLDIILDRRLNLTSLYQAVHPDPGVREVAAKYEQEFSKLETELQLSRPVYDAISAVDVSGEDATTRYYVSKTLRDFRRSGVDKDPATREKIQKLQEDLVKIGQDFSKNIREDVRSIKLDSPDQLAGLPQDFIENHQPGPDGKITITTDYPDYFPFIAYAKSDPLRFELYKKYRNRGYPANETVLHDMLAKRYELAKILGYKNYAYYVTEDKMIKNPEAAGNFIKRVSEIAEKSAATDYRELLRRLQVENPAAKEVGDWQKTYIGELVKKENYDFDSQALRQYFAYDRVRDGLFKITGHLFKVSYKKADVPVWDKSVEPYEIWSGDTLIGRFYLDMHPRKDKYKHAMMSQVVTGVEGRQVPEAALVCNFPGGDGTPGLMEHEQVETFFHEFGHLLHHIFAGRQQWVGISGIKTEWDFVETPSILLQEWAWDPAILKMFARNEAGEVIPDDLINKMNRTRKFDLGLNTEQQMFYAAISLNFYNQDYTKFDPLTTMKKLQAEYTPFQYVDDTHMYVSFGHLDNYSAIYYTYMWSEVIAKDLFSVFQKEGMNNSAVATRYRKLILEPGGSKDAASMVKEFLGRDFSFDAFEQWMSTQTD